MKLFQRILLSQEKLYWATFYCILLVGFVLRVSVFQNATAIINEYPDWSRDYLVAHHIVRYSEFPLMPPQTNQLGISLGSPIYFYFLAGILVVKDSMLFLGWANVALQVSTLLVIFFFAQILFGKTTALISLLFFSLSVGVINQSSFPWQPHIMQFFIVTSFCMLAWSYIKKNYACALASIVLFTFSAVLHVSVFAIFPAYIFACAYVFLLFSGIRKRIVYPVLIFMGTLFCEFLPRYIYIFSTTHQLSFGSLLITDAFERQSLIDIFSHNFLPRMSRFLNFFFPDLSSQSLFLFSLSIMLAVIGYFLLMKSNSRRKFYFGLFVISIIGFLIPSVLLHNDPINPFPVRYFTPIFGLFLIGIAELISAITSRMPSPVAIRITACFFFILILSPHLLDRLHRATSQLSYTTAYRLDPAVTAVANEIIALRGSTTTVPYFFQLKGYRIYYSDEDTFWNMLEYRFGVPLTKVSDEAFRNYRPLAHNAPYIFVICPSYQEFNGQEDCTDLFSRDYPNYAFIKKVYSFSPYKIYLAKRSS